MISLDEQIWREEVERWAEDALSMWKTQYNFWQRAQHQGAPPALLSELAALCEQFRTAHEKLVSLVAYFPAEGRR